jgi:hypothetical protein
MLHSTLLGQMLQKMNCSEYNPRGRIHNTWFYRNLWMNPDILECYITLGSEAWLYQLSSLLGPFVSYEENDVNKVPGPVQWSL